MFDPIQISTALKGIVGFRQPYNPDYAIVDSENQQSYSGLYVTDNPYAKIEFLKDTQDFVDIGDLDFNNLLRRMVSSSCINVCSQVFNDSAYIDRNLIYTKASNKTQIETLPHGFVGYRFRVDPDKNIAFKISRVLLDFEGTGDFELLLFNTAQKAPIKTQNITIASDHQEVILDWVIDNSGKTYKGDYYIGYISTELTVAPFKRNYLDGIKMSAITHLEIDKIYVPNVTTNILWDLNTLQFMNEANGLNLDITVYDDFTDLIIQNKNLFARAINLDCIISFLHSYATTLRSNSNERISDNIISRAMLEIGGSSGSNGNIKIDGLMPQFLREIIQIKDEIDKLKAGYFGDGIMVYTQE